MLRHFARPRPFTYQLSSFSTVLPSLHPHRWFFPSSDVPIYPESLFIACRSINIKWFGRLLLFLLPLPSPPRFFLFPLSISFLFRFAIHRILFCITTHSDIKFAAGPKTERNLILCSLDDPRFGYSVAPQFTAEQKKCTRLNVIARNLIVYRRNSNRIELSTLLIFFSFFLVGIFGRFMSECKSWFLHFQCLRFFIEKWIIFHW